jgi:hypothetical protein
MALTAGGTDPLAAASSRSALTSCSAISSAQAEAVDRIDRGGLEEKRWSDSWPASAAAAAEQRLPLGRGRLVAQARW